MSCKQIIAQIVVQEWINKTEVAYINSEMLGGAE